jgi:hypothetical protein
MSAPHQEGSVEPFATRDIDLTKAAKAKQSYPRYVFSESRTDLPT